MPQRRMAALLATFLCAGAAHAQSTRDSFDPGTLKGPAKGTPNEVMVLGSAHLAQLPAGFKPDAVRRLNERLLAWKPRIIAVEDRSGMQCDYRMHDVRIVDTAQVLR